MATKRAQRIGIWVIAIVMTVGTIGSFAAIVLANQNSGIDQAQLEKQYQDYLDQQKQIAQANADNSEGFGGYASRTFNTNVTELKVETLVRGGGAVVAETDSINASYFGWLPDGTIFDSSKKKSAADDAPVTFSLSGVITGWTEGLTGVKEGSVVRLTIPAAKGYSTTGSGIIPADTPLEFIVKIHKIDNSTGA